MSESDFYTLNEAAEVVGLHRQTLWRYARDGVIDSIQKWGKYWLLTEREVMRIKQAVDEHGKYGAKEILLAQAEAEAEA